MAVFQTNNQRHTHQWNKSTYWKGAFCSLEKEPMSQVSTDSSRARELLEKINERIRKEEKGKFIPVTFVADGQTTGDGAVLFFTIKRPHPQRPEKDDVGLAFIDHLDEVTLVTFDISKLVKSQAPQRKEPLAV